MCNGCGFQNTIQNQNLKLNQNPTPINAWLSDEESNIVGMETHGDNCSDCRNQST